MLFNSIYRARGKALAKSRRHFIKQLIQICSLFGLKSAFAWADWPERLFSATPYPETLKTLFPEADFIDTNKIHLKLPRIAENGAVVPLTITSSLPDIQKISVLVEKNPNPLSAQFQLSPLAEPTLSLRLKMAKSSDVIVIAETRDGQLLRTRKAVKVTIGGCGG